MNAPFPNRWFRIKERLRIWAVDVSIAVFFRSLLSLALGTVLSIILCVTFDELRWEYFFGGYVGAILIVWGIAWWLMLSSI